MPGREKLAEVRLIPSKDYREITISIKSDKPLMLDKVLEYLLILADQVKVQLQHDRDNQSKH